MPDHWTTTGIIDPVRHLMVVRLNMPRVRIWDVGLSLTNVIEDVLVASQYRRFLDLGTNWRCHYSEISLNTFLLFEFI